MKILFKFLIMAAGYSNNPLSKKLGLKKGLIIKLIHPPENYLKLSDNLGDARKSDKMADAYFDLIHLFTNSLEELGIAIPQLKLQIKKNGMIWISWYKKSSGQISELNENRIREVAIFNGLVDVKVCAIDENWSGLKLVYRLKDR